ncbi:MAG: methyltransferase [Bacteroidota bacterium]
MSGNSVTNPGPHRARFDRTLAFLQSSVAPPAKILDLGIENPFSQDMRDAGYEVANTIGQDLDDDFEQVAQSDADIITAFEIFEHMVAPYNVLKAIKAPHLVATVPLKLWFVDAYWNEEDPWDRHYHEFEDRQFDMVLEKAGWTIQRKEKWTFPVKKIGFRPLLRNITPRYYAVYCTRV